MQCGCSPRPSRAPRHAAGSHRGWGKPGMSSCHSPSASLASLIQLPTPRVAAALLSPPPPRIPSLSRDPPLAQSLPLVPEKSCKTSAAWSCSRVLASSRASSSHRSRLPPHLTASHHSPRHEGGSRCLEPPMKQSLAWGGRGKWAAHRAVRLLFAVSASPITADSPSAVSAVPLLWKLHGIL